MTTLHPTVLWAQRKDKIFLTIDVQNCKNPQISVDNDDDAKAGKVTFRGTAISHATGPEEHAYSLDLELYGEIDKDNVSQMVTDRTVVLVIAKKEEGPHWPRLLKTPGKAPLYVKADWDKWVDEDDEEEAPEEPGLAGFDPALFQQLQAGGGGMGGMGGGMGGFDLSQLGDLAAGGGLGAGMGDDEESDDDLPSLDPPGQ